MKTESQTFHGQPTIYGQLHDRPPIDRDALLSSCMKNVSFALSLVAELEASGREQVDSIVRLVSNGQAELAAEAAHSLKGAAAIIGASALSETAARLDAAADGEEDCAELGVAHALRDEMLRCLDYLPRLRADLSAASFDGSFFQKNRVR